MGRSSVHLTFFALHGLQAHDHHCQIPHHISIGTHSVWLEAHQHPVRLLVFGGCEDPLVFARGIPLVAGERRAGLPPDSL